MIDLSKSQPKRRGRPPKKTLKEEMAELREKESSEIVSKYDDPVPRRTDGSSKFKSKYTEDKVWLKHPRRELRPDGSVFIDPGICAEFYRNDWVAPDDVQAQMMRDKIEEEMKQGRPMHIVEITDSI